MSPRSRDRILDNLEAIYREAYERARKSGDEARMADLDASYQREQLILEVLLDVRDAISPAGDSPTSTTSTSTIEKLQALRKLTKLK
jgi:hypothetical protein